MPITALAGRADIMELCDPKAGARRVRFEGGTFSAHPATMQAGLTMIRYLAAHADEVYPKINRLGARIREEVPKIFAHHGIHAICTGHPNGVAPGSSMGMIQFPQRRAHGDSEPRGELELGDLRPGSAGESSSPGSRYPRRPHGSRHGLGLGGSLRCGCRSFAPSGG